MLARCMSMASTTVRGHLVRGSSGSLSASVARGTGAVRVMAWEWNPFAGDQQARDASIKAKMAEANKALEHDKMLW